MISTCIHIDIQYLIRILGLLADLAVRTRSRPSLEHEELANVKGFKNMEYAGGANHNDLVNRRCLVAG